MSENNVQAKFVFICVGRKKGLCSSKENAQEIWAHFKSYKGKPGYEHVKKNMREVTCLGVCKDGPCLLVIDEHGKDTTHNLGARHDNAEEAKQLLDGFMNDYIIDTTPPPQQQQVK